ncbi:M16 family metallopeptidase [Hydrocarboniphaga sp.]|uniref:M16 family metallopeptidase n=1 Tax=Hydrocarboniphaga sp. TaxID=2033016 RepID=UPI003D13488D
MRAAASMRLTLANGLRVLLHQDHRLPLVAVHLAYRVGAADEPEGGYGLSHLYEHLMYGGSANLPGSYIRQLSAIGAHDLNGRSLLDSTHYFETVNRDALDFALRAEADRMARLFTADSARVLDLQRDVVLNELRQYRERAEGQAFERLAEISYAPGHPYRHGIIGREADLQRITLDDARAFGRRHYHPGNAVLALAGDVDAEKAQRLCERHFGSLPAGDVTRTTLPEPPTAPAARHDVEAAVRSPLLYRIWNLPAPASQSEQQTQALLARMIEARFEARFSALRLQARYRYGRLGSQIEISLEHAGSAALARLDREWKQLTIDGFSDGEREQGRLRQQQLIAQRCDGLQAVAELMVEAELQGDGEEGDVAQLLSRLAAEPHELQLLPQPVGAVPDRDGAVAASIAVKDRSYRGIELFVSPAADGIALPVSRSPRLQHKASLLLAHRQHSGLLATRLIVPGGNALETGSQMGLAQLATTLLHAQLKPAAAALGVDISADAQPDCVRYGWVAATQQSLAVLGLVEAALSRPDFDGAALECARAQQLEAIASDIGRAETATERLLAAASGTPIANGQQTRVAALSLDDVLAFHRRQPEPIYLMVGKRSPVETGGFPRFPAAEEQSPGFDRASGLIDIAGAAQTLVTVAWPLPACDRRQEAALQMLDALLAGRFASRLNLRLREELGWTYGVRSRIGAAAVARRYQIQVWVPASRAADTRDEIIEAVERLIRDGIDEPAFRPLQRSEVLRQPGSIERVTALADLIETRLRLGLIDGEAWSGFEEAATLDAADVQAAAARCLPTEAAISVIAGDAAQLSRFGIDGDRRNTSLLNL